MKTRPLPDIDLARIAPMPRHEKRPALEQVKLKWPPLSYAPVRKHLLDILNILPGPLVVVPRTSWSVVEAAVGRASRDADEAAANLRIARGLYDFAEKHKFRGRRQGFYALPVGISEKVTYWLDAVLEVDGLPLVAFVDPRRTRKLTVEGRRFALSAMNERIRVADPDYANVGLGIIQFRDGEGGARMPRLYTAEGVELFTFDELDVMVRETYEIWYEVLQEREEETRRKAGGIKGSLL